MVKNILENARGIENIMGTIHMVQNTKALLYHSTITFLIGSTFLQHPYWLQNVFYN